MDISTLRSFFMWCTVVNAGLLALSFLFIALAGEWIYRMHRRWFPMSKENFSMAMYCFLALFKILILVFNLAPYIALLIMG
ncbi:MAG TPA: hypothetical protein PKH07_04505 [bacterium]|nr:hypothetical protein [bacterium]